VTEAEVTRCLYLRIRTGVVVAAPRFTPTSWWECDLLAVSKARFGTEYEVKLTRADFKADTKKARRALGVYPPQLEFKHMLLRQASERGPNRFYYVVPEGMIALNELPEWAGLIEVREFPSGRIVMGYRRKAPLIHRLPVPEATIERMRVNLCHRYWWMLMRPKNLTEIEVAEA